MKKRIRNVSWSFLTLLVATLAWVPCVRGQGHGVTKGEWPSFGGDPGNAKYSPLDQIDRENFKDLKIAWRWTSISKDVTTSNRRVRAGQFKATPLMVDGKLFVSTAISQVAAVDAGTGKLVWSYDPKSYKSVVRPANLGWQHRGVAYWSDGDDSRILIATHDLKLIAINAKTGELCSDFGNKGKVDLSKDLGRSVEVYSLTHSSPPAICRDTVVVGSIVQDGIPYKKGPPGHVRGYDVRTGKRKWIFHTIPQIGEFGVESWEDESWQYSGACNVWSMMAVDNELGYVYLPTGTPTSDFYGGHRLGNNLFAESVICLDGESGKRVWHFQCVHHGLWDYDLPTAPTLMDITVNGKKIKAIAQISKQGFTYVFDRVSGKPIWPIEERPTPVSSVPGERASKTQPFPTKPAPFERQGLTEDDLIDLTPELRKEALEIVAEHYTIGPLFTPPRAVEQGKPVINLPGDGGGANWQGAAFDPDTDVFYVPSQSTPKTLALSKPDPARSDLNFLPKGWTGGVRGPQGLPLIKPPYARITAIDMGSGDHRWMVPHGDGPRNHPAIKHLNPGPLGASGFHAGGPLVTKTLLFVTHGGRGVDRGRGARRLTVYDKKTGEYLGAISLPADPYGNPITYLHQGKQWIVVAVGGGRFGSGGGGVTPELIAFSLP